MEETKRQSSPGEGTKRESSPGEGTKRESSPGEGTQQDYRVQVTSKRQVTEQVKKYKDILKTALEGQTETAEDTKRVLLQELLANFEAAVQDNVLVNGQPWEEAPDVEEEEEAVDLDSLLDDTVVETTRRRRAYPKKILPHVVHSLRAERKVLGLYECAVKPQEVVKDPDQESIMKDLSAAAPGMVKQAIQVIKSINTLQKQAEGLCEILDMKPSHATLEIHREVFGHGGQSDDALPPASGDTRNRLPIKRAVEEAAARDCYVPLRKKPVTEGTA
ncbi:kinetochore-associated protein NSL1 homolog isoform X1 [Larimichthys crocea]|uniref:kinetochore-associated protein NSL1 homolog isoform X1 n=1 Tax=Larimichthys crocea TaxID=215358 RepID=UPI000622D8DE|nr:kinetochore-associated protein NSL1 homolog isoform X1 [Larimichthys crocea]